MFHTMNGNDKDEVKLQEQSREELLLEIEKKDELIMSKDLQNQHNRLLYDLDRGRYKDKIAELRRENIALKEELRRIKNLDAQPKKSSAENLSVGTAVNIFSQKPATIKKELGSEKKQYSAPSRVP